jgi:hypothetical protein
MHTPNHIHTHTQTEQAQWLSTLLGDPPVSSYMYRGTLHPSSMPADPSPSPCVLTYPPSTFPSPSFRCPSPSLLSMPSIRCVSPSLRSLHPSTFWRSPSPIDESPLFPSTYSSQNNLSDIPFTPNHARGTQQESDAPVQPALTLQLSRRPAHLASVLSPADCPPPPSSTPMPGYEYESRLRDVLDSSVWDFQVM